MTVPSDVIRNEYTGNGSGTDFAFDFKIFADSDLLVSIADADGVDVSDDFVLDTDYSITINDDDTGGIVTFGSALPSNYTLVLTPNLGIVQETVINNQGGFFPKVVENALDRLTIICKQLQEQINRKVGIDVLSGDAPEDYLATAQAAATAAAAAETGAVSAETGAQTAEAGATTQAANAATSASNAAAVAADLAGLLNDLELIGSPIVDSFAGDGSDTTFTLSNDPITENNTNVFLDGVYQAKSEYSVSGTTLTFGSAPANGVAIEVVYGRSQSIGTPGDGTVGTTKIIDEAVTYEKLELDIRASIDLADTAVQPADIEDIGSVLLASYTTTLGQAAIEIESVFSSTYDEYEIVFTNLAPQSDAVTLESQFSRDNGANYDTASYAWTWFLHSTTTTTDGDSSHTSMRLTGNTGSAAQEHCSGRMLVQGVNQTTFLKTIDGTLVNFNSSGLFTAYRFGGARLAASSGTAVVNAMRLFWSSGNFQAGGTVKVYGLKK